MAHTGRLVLGPIVGHTSHESVRIWIQVEDNPADYVLRISNLGLFQFVSTEAPGPLEFRTAIVHADGLRADWGYRYAVLRHGKAVNNGRGTFRTMPEPGSMANLTFVAISCNDDTGKDGKEKEGLWNALGKYISDAQPQFLLMVGDQVYLDEGAVETFEDFRKDPDRTKLRKTIAERYRSNWSRSFVRNVLANIPVYMMWDDHDIRDGWGSAASDSLTLAAKYWRGKRIYEKCHAYFEDCRDAYWHFQACHNPGPDDGISPLAPNIVTGIPTPSIQQAMPYAFRCGRLAVIILDSRGERDVFRQDRPILGATQWEFIEAVFDNLPPDIDALAVITPTPIASIDPHGQTLKIMGDRTDDVDAFKIGDEDGALAPESTKDLHGGLLAILNLKLSRVSGPFGDLNLGNFKIGNIDEARDQWSHKYSRPEQEALIRAAGRARVSNRSKNTPRGLIFVSGDIHVGARFKITCEDPGYEAESVTASGINTVHADFPTIDVLLSRDFEVASGIRSVLQEVVVDFNFAVVEIVPTGGGAAIQAAVAHKGASSAFGVDFGLYL